MSEPSDNLKEQLRTASAKLRENRSVIRPVSQVMIRLKPVSGKDRFALTVEQVLRWMNNRAGRDLPDAAWRFESFEHSDIGAQRVAAIALPAAGYWAARLDDADKAVPLRSWVTEVGVGLDDTSGDVLFGARLICVTRGADTPFDRSIPGFVKGVLTTGPAELDGELISPAPKLVSTQEDVERFVRLLERRERIADVIAFSLPEGSADFTQTAASVREFYSPNPPASGVMGAAHVYVLTSDASFELTDRVGKELSVFRQGVRTYKPGFESWIDDPSRHRLALPQRIAAWQEEGPSAFVRWLVNQTLADTVRGTAREKRLPSFNTVRQLSAQESRSRLQDAGGSDLELQKLYEADNELLRREISEQKATFDGLLATADEDRELAVDEANAARAHSFVLRERIRALEEQLSSLTNRQPTPIPETLEDFQSWCQEHLAGVVEMTTKAYQGVRKSEYHDPTVIYKALLLLRDYYVPMRIEGGSERRQAFDAALAGLNLEESATGDAIKYDDALYSVQYGSRRRLLDRHLKGGDSRNRQYGFRLYFFWDDEEQVVVVGWLPSHLDSKLT